MVTSKRVEQQSVESANWFEEEFQGIALGDARLDKRFYKLCEQLSSRPEAYINQACEDWGDAKAAYRFFDNERVTEQKILSAHRRRVLQRMLAHSVVLALQDTTELDYTSHRKTSGLGPIGNHRGGAHGLRVHSTLAVTLEGVPLGLLYQEIEARRVENVDHLSAAQKRRRHMKKAPSQKESMRWIRSLERTDEYSSSFDLDAHEQQQQQQQQQPPLVVTVADREADIFEFLLVAEQRGAPYLVRASHDRLVMETEQRRLWELMERAEVAGCFTTQVPDLLEEKKKAGSGEKKSRKKKKTTTSTSDGGGKATRTRQAKLELRYLNGITLEPTKRRAEFRMEGWGPVKVNAIYIREVVVVEEVEAGEEDEANPLEWMLLTNLEVEGLERAIEKVEWYCLRWQIETYHKVLKSGCRVEECQLATGERLSRYVALMSVVAWRMFWMTLWQRVADRETPCTVALTEHEWKALYCKVQRTNSLPEHAPTLREAVRWIARLGGFLGRKSDGEPGVTVMWRGWCRLTDLADLWLITHPEQSCG